MFRSAVTSDLDLLLSARQADPVGMVDAAWYRRELDVHRCRLEWSWLYEVDGRLLARALWWGLPDADHPVSLDCLWVDPSVADPIPLTAGLVSAGHRALRASGLDRLPDLTMTVEPRWRDDPAALAAIAWRTGAVAAAGLTQSIERLSYAWTDGKPRPTRSSRLSFAPGDDQSFLNVFAAVSQGSLDLLTLQNLAEMGAEAQAADDLGFYLNLPGERELWRLAYDSSGQQIGFIIPSRSAYDASVSYLGVVPEHRGHGYVNDLLAEITHMHTDAGADRITGTTDTTNAPMAAAFLRGGYEVTATRIIVGPQPI